MEFKDKKIIITGANRSIGQKMALEFAEQGADIVISYHHDLPGAEATVQAIKAMGRDAWALQADFTHMENIASFAKAAIEYLGHVDILVNNAGTLCRESILDLAPEKMQQVFQINTVAPLYLLQLCARNMIQHNIKGVILNISSISGNMCFPKRTGYAASKAAMNKFTQNAALDLGEYGIRVNAIAPGVLETGMNEDTARTNPALWQERLNDIPLKRAGTAADIANMALYLASDKANWITGKIFEVDGGHGLKK